MNTKIDIHKRILNVRVESLKYWSIPSIVKEDILKFIDDLELGKVNKGRKISESRRLKYLDLLKTPLEFWKMSIQDLTLEDIENFEKALSSGTIKSKRKNQPFMESTKADIRKAIKIFLRWKLGPEKALVLSGWLDTRETMKTPDFLKEAEIERLYKSCRKAEQRFLIAVLFDTGARAEEFHNIRYEDIHLPEGEENYVKITLKEEYSKTKGRTVSLYWKYSIEAVRDYLFERIQQGIKSSDPVYNNNYDASRRWLHRLGKDTLDKAIHYHLFRHSSATYYATKLNRQELCYRYGWKFSSNMPDVYISRAGMESKELDEKFNSTEMSELKERLVKQEQENRILKDVQDKLRDENEVMRKEMEEIKQNIISIKNNARNIKRMYSSVEH